MTSDANKGITGVLYNHLNMPSEIKFNNSNTQKINYTYSADGIKLRKATNNGGVISTTDYAGNFIYENNTLKQFYQPEGYVEPKGSSWQYVYQYKDIWRNTRITYADDNNSGSVTSAEIRREQNYYPFGLEHKGYNFASYGAKNNLKTYQGQEFTEDLGLNTHEWKYRMSDPSTGRFWQIDPLAEEYTYNSTYAFQENKMGMGVELEGLEMVDFSSHDPGLRGATKQEIQQFKRTSGEAFVKAAPLAIAVATPIPGDEVFVGGLLFKTGVAAVDAASQVVATGEVDIFSVALNFTPMGPLTKEATDALIDLNIGADGTNVETGFGSTDGSAKSTTSVVMDFFIGTVANKVQSNIPSEVTSTPVGNVLTQAGSTGAENIGGDAIKTQLEKEIQNE